MAAEKNTKGRAAAEKAKKGAKPTKARQPRSAKTAGESKPKKLSALDAAAKVLAETGEAMSCKALIETMTAKGYWASPAGRTPWATLYSALTREIATKGAAARFRKIEAGKFGFATPQKKGKSVAEEPAVALHTEA